MIAVAEQVTYYGLLLSRDTRNNPSGLARRRILPDGGIMDETFQEDLQWHRDTVILEWWRGESGEDLVEISKNEAKRIMERFRETFGE
jgi:hypothetical protein